MANKTTWKSIKGRDFRRKMWFARLRAAGLYRSRCKAGVGLCKNITSGSAAALKANEFAHVSPRGKIGKKKYEKMLQRGRDVYAKGFHKKEGTPQVAALLQNLRKLKKDKGSLGGAKFSLTKADARVKQVSGKVTKRTTAAAMKTNKKNVKEIKKGLNDAFAKTMQKREKQRKLQSTQIKQLKSKFSAMERGERTPTPFSKAKKQSSKSKLSNLTSRQVDVKRATGKIR
jgi:hypothetical protein